LRIHYNDFEPSSVAWLRELIQFGLLPEGDVDSRSIKDVKADELRGYDQCHFFAGIGGWPLAMQLAGIQTAKSVWTGSCPCQPFSAAGKRKGVEDDRHLWPEFRRLIDERKPATVFGEQVASKDGRDWLAIVRSDLEALGYEVGAADLCAAGVGAPHIRQRLFWVAHSDKYRRRERREDFAAEKHDGSERNGTSSGMANGSSSGLEERQEQPTRQELAAIERSGDAHWLANGQSDRREQGIANYRWSDSRIRTQREFGRPAWDGSNIEFVPCRDGKARPVKPGVCVLAYGVSGRVAQLRGLGNAIVPQVAAEFIRAAWDSIGRED
jgi:DNA (cytosine-5)-methyltransferase 1